MYSQGKVCSPLDRSRLTGLPQVRDPDVEKPILQQGIKMPWRLILSSILLSVYISYWNAKVYRVPNTLALWQCH